MDSTAKSSKPAWRDRMQAHRRQVAPEARAAAGQRVCARLLAWPPLPRGACIASYISLPTELPTEAVHEGLVGMACSIAVPAWSAAEHRYRFAAWQPGEALAAGPMHVPEPAVKRWVATGTIACFLVPGLAFDHQGGRIGHGAGFYDRLLATRAPESLCVAIGYDWQLVDDDLPQSAHDVRMDWIITPERTIRTAIRLGFIR